MLRSQANNKRTTKKYKRNMTKYKIPENLNIKYQRANNNRQENFRLNYTCKFWLLKAEPEVVAETYVAVVEVELVLTQLETSWETEAG